MVDRKKKLRFVQIILLFTGIIIVLFTYLQKNKSIESSIISKEIKTEINDNLLKKNEDNFDVFYDISYNGIDLAGNRYVLKSEEAKNFKTQPETVYMKEVNAIFYFNVNKKVKELYFISEWVTVIMRGAASVIPIKILIKLP